MELPTLPRVVNHGTSWVGGRHSRLVQAIHHEHSRRLHSAGTVNNEMEGPDNLIVQDIPTRAYPPRDRMTAGRGRFVRRPRGIGRPDFPG